MKLRTFARLSYSIVFADLYKGGVGYVLVVGSCRVAMNFQILTFLEVVCCLRTIAFLQNTLQIFCNSFSGSC